MVRICLLLYAALLPAQDDSALVRLQHEMDRVAKVTDGITGAAAIHLETGRRVVMNGQVHYPMASTVKIPIAVQLLTLVDQGKERLDRMIALQPRDLHPGSGTLTDLFNKPGVALSVRNLLELMLLISDNSATDVLLRAVGGAEAVNARLKEIGIEGMRVDRPTVRLIADASSIELPSEEQWRPGIYRELAIQVDPKTRAEAQQKFRDDPRDTSTPMAMANLLEKVHRKELLKPDTADLLLDILRRCRTGQARLKGLLPADTEVAHKTGSMPGVVNDVGILKLPDNAGHVALAVFVKNGTDDAKMERAIAEVARSVHDFFLYHPKGAIDFEKLAASITGSLRVQRGEHVFLRPDSTGYFSGILDPLRRRLSAAGAAETGSLDDADIYLWLPLQPGGPGLPAAEREALRRWTDKGGTRRQVHFHWGEGSSYADGQWGEHNAQLDVLYQDALDIDRDALSKTQDSVIAQLRSGMVRVRTPAGTDIRFRTGNRPFNKQDGDASPDRARRAQMRIDRDIELPSGVVRVAPLEETATGVLVVPEGRFAGSLARNVKFHFQKGTLTKVEAAENLAAVEKMIAEGGDAAKHFREFAIGTHPKLKPAPGAKILPYYGYGEGVVRLSLGDNEELGGNVRGGFVRWLFFPDAKVEVNGKPLRIGVN